MSEPRLAEYQLSKAEAMRFCEENRWEPLSPAERALFQLRQELLCMPFGKFHEVAEQLLGRPVWTHEFAYPDQLWDECQTGTPISFADVLAKIPDHLRPPIIVTVEQEQDRDA